MTIISDIKQAYKQSPFFYWFVFLLVTNWVHWSPIEQFRTSLWINQLWITVFFVLFTINFFVLLKIKTIYESSKKYKGDKRPLVIICATVALFLVMDLPLFLIGIIEIMTSQCPQIIVDPIKLQQNLLAGMIMEFIIPLTHHLGFLPARKFLNKQFFQKVAICPRDELEISLSCIFLSLFLSLSIVEILNYMAFGPKLFTGVIGLVNSQGLPQC